MAISVARVHLKMAHAALPGLLPTPPKWKMLRLLPTPCPCLAAILPKPLAKSISRSRADSDERWDAHKTKSASTESPASISRRSSSSCAGRGSSRRNAASPPKPGRADSAERWDAHKKAASPASPSPSSSGTSPVSCASSTERWDVHKKRRPPQADPLDDGGNSYSSSTDSNDIDDTDEEILWKPRAIYAGPGFAVATPEPSTIPMSAAFLVPVAQLHCTND